MRLIDAAALKRQFRVNSSASQRVIEAEIDASPTIDPVRHGRWERESSLTNYGCTSCGARSWDRWDYCPWCGARMDGEGEKNG